MLSCHAQKRHLRDLSISFTFMDYTLFEVWRICRFSAQEDQQNAWSTGRWERTVYRHFFLFLMLCFKLSESSHEKEPPKSVIFHVGSTNWSETSFRCLSSVTNIQSMLWVVQTQLQRQKLKPDFIPESALMAVSIVCEKKVIYMWSWIE